MHRLYNIQCFLPGFVALTHLEPSQPCFPFYIASTHHWAKCFVHYNACIRFTVVQTMETKLNLQHSVWGSLTLTRLISTFYIQIWLDLSHYLLTPQNNVPPMQNDFLKHLWNIRTYPDKYIPCVCVKLSLVSYCYSGRTVKCLVLE